MPISTIIVLEAEVEGAAHVKRKATKEKSWMKRAAEEADLDFEESDGEEDEVATARERSATMKRKQQVNEMRTLLRDPLRKKGR